MSLRDWVRDGHGAHAGEEYAGDRVWQSYPGGGDLRQEGFQLETLPLAQGCQEIIAGDVQDLFCVDGELY